ncbi:MAG: phosphate acyltransferase PlsX [Bacillota bacterium]
MNIVVDAMGGDNAPQEIVKGAVNACKNKEGFAITLVGKNELIENELNKFENFDKNRIKIKNAREVITMNDSPARALRKKKDSSLSVASKMIANNEGDALISAGNTGAVMSAGLFNIGRLSGIKRPSISTLFPAENGYTLLMDAGANTDSDPENLIQFAVMGDIYARKIMNIDNPKIGLLSIGEEEKKGNDLVKKTHKLLKKDKRISNFIGNVEGRDVFNDKADIIICDGFVGNVVLKTTEGAASFMFDLLKEAFTKNFLSKLGAAALKPQLKEMMKKLDYKQYGGAPLLGINGIAIISHGSSDETAIVNAINVAIDAVENNIVNLIEKEINKDGV